LVFVGTWKINGNPAVNIFVYRFDPSTGALVQVGKVSRISDPMYLAIDPSGRYLLAVSIDDGIISSYSIDSTGKLTLINSQQTGGAVPVYVSIDPSGKWVLVANYLFGSLAVLPLGDDGLLGEATALVHDTGSGPNPDRQEGPHVHSVIFAPGGHLVLAADLGIDKVMLYDLDTNKGTLAPHAVPALELRPGSGPRQMVFSPDGRFLYVVSELHSTVTSYQYDASTETFQELEIQFLIPADFKGQNLSADVHITPDGRFLYASNRGHDSLTIFAIDQSSGKMNLVGYASTQGKTPVNFAIDPTGTFLIVANQDSNTIVTFRIDPTSGKLTPTGETVEVTAPACIKFMQK
jgi:6-phosphogluconolactonase